jgi:hypothetical protein
MGFVAWRIGCNRGRFELSIVFMMLTASGTFVWVSGPSHGVSVENHAQWLNGEPNDADNNEDCIATTSTGLWQDRVCGSLLAFLVEFECPTGWSHGALGCQGRSTERLQGSWLQRS